MSWKTAKELEAIRCHASCEVCKLRQSDSLNGWLCSLTELPANFNSECASFEIDIEEKKHQRQQLTEQIDSLVTERDSEKKQPGYWAYLVDDTNRQPLNDLPTELSTQYAGFRFIGGILLLGIGALGLGLSFYLPLSEYLSLFFLFLVLSGGIWCYFFNPSVKVITISQQGIKYRKNALLPWAMVKFAFFRIDDKSSPTANQLILLLTDGTQCKIPGSAIGPDRTGLGHLVYSFMAHYKKN